MGGFKTLYIEMEYEDEDEDEDQKKGGGKEMKQ